MPLVICHFLKLAAISINSSYYCLSSVSFCANFYVYLSVSSALYLILSAASLSYCSLDLRRFVTSADWFLMDCSRYRSLVSKSSWICFNLWDMDTVNSSFSELNLDIEVFISSITADFSRAWFYASLSVSRISDILFKNYSCSQSLPNRKASLFCSYSSVSLASNWRFSLMTASAFSFIWSSIFSWAEANSLLSEYRMSFFLSTKLVIRSTQCLMSNSGPYMSLS